MNQPADRPPILLFLMMFTGLLVIAVCLAALEHVGERADDIGSMPGAQRAETMPALSQTPQRVQNRPSRGEPTGQPASNSLQSSRH